MAAALLLLLPLLSPLPGADAVSTLRHTIVRTGASVTIPCLYEDKYKSRVKTWGFYDKWGKLKTLIRTDSPITDSDKVSISDDPAQGVFTVTMRGLETGDTGDYYCAVETEGPRTRDDRAELQITVTAGKTLKSSSTHLVKTSKFICHIHNGTFVQRRSSGSPASVLWPGPVTCPLVPPSVPVQLPPCCLSIIAGFQRPVPLGAPLVVKTSQLLVCLGVGPGSSSGERDHSRQLAKIPPPRRASQAELGNKRAGSQTAARPPTDLRRVTTRPTTVVPGQIPLPHADSLGGRPHKNGKPVEEREKQEPDSASGGSIPKDMSLCLPSQAILVGAGVKKGQAPFVHEHSDGETSFCVFEKAIVHAGVLYVVNATVTGQIGGEVSVQCRYGNPYRSRQKQWCRSGDWSSCQTAGSPGTAGHGSVLITDHTAEGLFSVTVSGLRPEDQGWYWCDISDQQLPVYLKVTEAKTTATPATTSQQTSSAVHTAPPTGQSSSLPPEDKDNGDEGGEKHNASRYKYFCLFSFMVCEIVFTVQGQGYCTPICQNKIYI
ncbi:polymeric immunoglobulin receptor-like [Amia ocellicauda]|uniref:polymeric immunoglobulin receptor-like n=1 Tax=Amia ocellicauda TaxID=2972642 RepID=UPI003463B42E